MELKEEKATGTTSAEKRMGATPPPTSHPGEDDDDAVRPAKRRAARRSGAAQVRNKKFQSGQKIYLCRPRSASLALDRQYIQARIAATLRNHQGRNEPSVEK